MPLVSVASGTESRADVFFTLSFFFLKLHIFFCVVLLFFFTKKNGITAKLCESALLFVEHFHCIVLLQWHVLLPNKALAWSLKVMP